MRLTVYLVSGDAGDSQTIWTNFNSQHHLPNRVVTTSSSIQDRNKFCFTTKKRPTSIIREPLPGWIGFYKRCPISGLGESAGVCQSSYGIDSPCHQGNQETRYKIIRGTPHWPTEPMVPRVTTASSVSETTRETRPPETTTQAIFHQILTMLSVDNWNLSSKL